jgi:hypothetical protein
MKAVPSSNKPNHVLQNHISLPKEKWIDDVMRSADEVVKAPVPDDLSGKIMARIFAESEGRLSLHNDDRTINFQNAIRESEIKSDIESQDFESTIL